LYSNIPNSGIAPSDPINYDSDFDWKNNGYLETFDQRPLLKIAMVEYLKQGGDANVDHQLNDYGYFYYPEKCVVDNN